MKSQNSHPTNFWFGFALGTLSTATVAYLLGTKKGRETLKKLLELSENVDLNSPDLLDGIHEVVSSLKSIEKNPQVRETEEAIDEAAQSIETVIDKIKTVSQPKKYIKKFFAKSGKIIEP